MKKYRQHFRGNFNLAYPVMLSQLGHVMVGVADSVMVGRLGAEPLAAASLANVIFHLLLLFGIGVSYAITPLVAAADGEGDVEKSASAFLHGTIINVALALILVTGVLLGWRGMYYLDQPEEVLVFAVPYLKIIVISILPVMIFQSARQFAEGLSQTRQAMFITITGNALNIFLNWVLIFGKLGFPAYGILGAGYATLISRFVIAGGMWAYLQGSSRYSQYLARLRSIKITRQVISKMLHIGLPTGFQFIFEVGAFGFSAIMIGWMGAKPLAAHQIAINMAAISYMMASGLSAAATIRVGNQLGRKDILTLRNVAFSIFIMVVIFMMSFALLFIVGRFFLPTLYIDDSEVIGLASSLLIIAAFFQISDGVQVVGLGALRGLADVKIPTLITFISYWIIALPVAYLLGFTLDMGINGIWWGLLIGLTVAAVSLFIRFNGQTRKRMHAA